MTRVSPQVPEGRSERLALYYAPLRRSLEAYVARRYEKQKES